MSLTSFGSELSEERGYGTNNGFVYLAKALKIQSSDKITRENTLAKFRELDVDNSGLLDSEELVDWAIKNKVFGPDVDDETVKKVAHGIFKDSKVSADGMTPEKFYMFIKGIQNQAKQLALASKHHCMQIPSSMKKFNAKNFTLEAIERELHQKITQNTTRDSDRARTIVNLFKTQLQRSSGEVDENASTAVGIDKPQFKNVLGVLGVFATAEQAGILFDKYDINGDGDLTVHEFLTKAYPDDYPGMAALDASRYYDFRMGGAGKRLFPEEGIGARPQTPHHAVYALNQNVICSTVRNKIEASLRSGVACSIPFCRRKLAIKFENFDPTTRGWTSKDDLIKALASLNLSYGNNQYNELLDAHPYDGDNTKFDYVSFCMKVYPLQDQERSVQTSLIHDSPNSAYNREAKIAEKKAAMSPTQRRAVYSDQVSQVNKTGFYYQPPSPSNAGAIPRLQTGSGANSRQLSSRLEHQMRMSTGRGKTPKSPAGEEQPWRSACMP